MAMAEMVGVALAFAFCDPGYYQEAFLPAPNAKGPGSPAQGAEM